ncbi:hypothetical protein [Variovorax sp. PBL-E5]|uniref:hypothetical protein n=1 Tax=Variovorax sp. PBL-E5 TaxID=434014 RepID=UPI0013A56483|nr:hypothetical protein [Variovorax sp. PBL-E5]
MNIATTDNTEAHEGTQDAAGAMYDGRPGPDTRAPLAFPCALLVTLDTGETLRITGVVKAESVIDFDVTPPRYIAEMVEQTAEHALLRASATSLDAESVDSLELP